MEKPEGYDALVDKLVKDNVVIEHIKPEFHGLYGANVQRISLKEAKERWPDQPNGDE